MNNQLIPCTLIGFLVLFIQGCSTQQPVLYPNARYNSVGARAAKADVRACIDLANRSGAASDKMADVAEDTARAAAVGGAAGAVSGALFGRPGKGAAVGAAGGSTATLVHGLLDSDKPDKLHQRFVEKCLRDRGYDPIGWS